MSMKDINLLLIFYTLRAMVFISVIHMYVCVYVLHTCWLVVVGYALKNFYFAYFNFYFLRTLLLTLILSSTSIKI